MPRKYFESLQVVKESRLITVLDFTSVLQGTVMHFHWSWTEIDGCVTGAEGQVPSKVTGKAAV